MAAHAAKGRWVRNGLVVISGKYLGTLKTELAAGCLLWKVLVMTPLVALLVALLMSLLVALLVVILARVLHSVEVGFAED